MALGAWPRSWLLSTASAPSAVLALGLGLLSTPSFASGYVVNCHAASPAEAQVLVASGVQQGAWVVNGYGIAPAEHASFNSGPTACGVLVGPNCGSHLASARCC